MRFSDVLLDEIRAALPVSVVVGKRVALKKEGHELKGLSPFNKEKTASFCVNDAKGMWYDFSAGKNGNVFQFEMEVTGCTFEEAVERCAKLAGISLPAAGYAGRTGKPARAAANGHHEPDSVGGQRESSGVAGPPATSRQITETYDYEDADGSVIYQVCRIEWTEAGRAKKSFLQRRAVEGRPGEWAWGLKAGPYVRGGNGDWYALTDEREHWQGDRVTLDDVSHGLYRFTQLREEMAQDADDRRTVFIPEGERKVDVHTRWGLVATCSSGGARHWLPHHAQEFMGADVVIEADNDKAGREGAEKKAISLRGLAARVRVLHWGDAWSSCPAKGDVVDFERAGNGVAEFFKIVDSLKDWTPSLPETTHGAVRFSDLDRPGRVRLQWLIKGLITRGDVSIWYGQPGCGKSYLVTDAAFSINRGISWMGRRVRRGLVIYQAGEGGVGFEDRMRAYRDVHGRAAVDGSSFIMWPQRINLYNGDADVDAMIDEARGWSSYFDEPLELLIVDTVSAATTGADENASKDMSVVVDRAWKFAKATGAHVALIHHMPKGGGGPRGSGVLIGNVSTQIEVIKTEEMYRQVDGNQVRMRAIRKFVVRKQKDGIDDTSCDFILNLVILGKDEDGDDITQNVVQQVNEQTSKTARGEVPVGWAIMKPNSQFIMRGLVKALNHAGGYPPKDEMIRAPEMTPCVKVSEWITALCELRFTNDPDDPPTDKFQFGAKLYARCKKAVERTYSEYEWSGRLNLLGKDREWVWRTSRKVAGVDEVPAPTAVRDEPQRSFLAPGETEDDVKEGFT